MNKRTSIFLIYLLPLPVLLLSLFVGPSENMGWGKILSFLWHPDAAEPLVRTILLDIRLPRVLLVFCTGGVLALSGAALQAIFRNPLVDPYVLGLSSGAAFGAALALWTPWAPVQVSAFVFAVAAVGLSFFMARKNRQVSIVSLILAGIITNGIFTALLTVVQILSDPYKLQGIVHWIMGNFHTAGWDKLQMAILPMAAGVVILYFLRWRLNVLALGDDEAAAVGINPSRLKWWSLLAVTLSGSAAVAVSGIIGLYGLMVPHVVRMLFGVDNRQTLLLNLLLGGSFLVIIDNISRSMAGFEIPIGVFTMLLGAPFFIWLLKKSNIGWEH